MEKQNRRPLIIALAALCAIIVVTLAVALIMRGRGGTRFSVGENAPYPYSWVERKNGAIALTMETGEAKDGVWSLESTDGGIADIRVGKTRGGKTSVTITPNSAGREIMAFSLTSGEDRLAQLDLTVMAGTVEGENETLAATVTAYRERVFQGSVRGGEETGHPFTVRGDNGGLTIFVEETEGYTDDGMAWESESTNVMAAYVSTIDVSEEGLTFRLETRSSGSAEVRVFSAREKIAFVFDVEVSGGNMLLTDSRTEPYEPYELEEEAEEAGSGENWEAS